MSQEECEDLIRLALPKKPAPAAKRKKAPSTN
jgi:hypothetical protein